jgi:hypothetical protein
MVNGHPLTAPTTIAITPQTIARTPAMIAHTPRASLPHMPVALATIAAMPPKMKTTPITIHTTMCASPFVSGQTWPDRQVLGQDPAKPLVTPYKTVPESLQVYLTALSTNKSKKRRDTCKPQTVPPSGGGAFGFYRLALSASQMEKEQHCGDGGTRTPCRMALKPKPKTTQEGRYRRTFGQDKYCEYEHNDRRYGNGDPQFTI